MGWWDGTRLIHIPIVLGLNSGIEIWICNNLTISFVNRVGAVARDISLPSCRRWAIPASSSKKTVTKASSEKNQNGIVLKLKNKNKKLNHLIRRKPAGLSDSPIRPLVGPPIQLVRFRFNHFSGQLTWPDRNHDLLLVWPVQFGF